MLNTQRLARSIILLSAMIAAPLLAMSPASASGAPQSLWDKLFNTKTSYGLTALADPTVTRYCDHKAQLDRAEAFMAAASEAETHGDYARLRQLSTCVERQVAGLLTCAVRAKLIDKYSNSATTTIDHEVKAAFIVGEKHFSSDIQTPEFNKCDSMLTRPNTSTAYGI
ncbi:MAG TPA: hypothetical protein VJJ83_01175 [Candidatus Babeliales bacterium]|nr:hypothetical protein [Candidatus Babeliales bacterium]